MGNYPVSKTCPKCDSKKYTKIAAETVISFAPDRICSQCKYRYTPPTPRWAGVVFIVCGLALWVEFTWLPPLWVHAVLWLPLICLLTAIFLRLSKSALLVLQYKHKAGEGRIE